MRSEILSTECVVFCLDQYRIYERVSNKCMIENICQVFLLLWVHFWELELWLVLQECLWGAIKPWFWDLKQRVLRWQYRFLWWISWWTKPRLEVGWGTRWSMGLQAGYSQIFSLEVNLDKKNCLQHLITEIFLLKKLSVFWVERAMLRLWM